MFLFFCQDFSQTVSVCILDKKRVDNDCHHESYKDITQILALSSLGNNLIARKNHESPLFGKTSNSDV